MVEKPDFPYDLGSREAVTAYNRIVLKRDNDPVELRELMLQDLEKFYELFNSSKEHIRTFLPDYEYDLESLYDMKARIQDALVDDSFYSFGIWDRDTLVGEQRLFIDSDNSAETTTWVGVAYTRNHYASKARALIINFAFSHLRVKKLISHVSVNNAASKKILENANYTYVGKDSGLITYILPNPNLAPQT